MGPFFCTIHTKNHYNNISKIKSSDQDILKMPVEVPTKQIIDLHSQRLCLHMEEHLQ